MAQQHGAVSEHIACRNVRKEDVVARVLAARGDAPGLVHGISVMETCATYKPRHDKASGPTILRLDPTKCLHYYFYWMDRELGLIYVRAPTYCPFRLQVYCNGHSWLAQRLAREGIGFATADNAFVRIGDWARAQELADGLNPELLHRHLDRYVKLCCSVLEVFAQTYHWSILQVEYSTDLVFKSGQILAPLYAQIAREAVLAVKAEQVATFLGEKITPQLTAELRSRLRIRIEGTCIKHRLRSCSVKLSGQVRPQPAHLDHHQRCLVLQAPPQGATRQRTHHARGRSVEEVDLQAHRSVRDIARLQSRVPRVPLQPGRPQRRPAFARAHHPPQARRRRFFQGPEVIFDRNDQAPLRAVQHPELNIHGLARCDLQHLLPDPSASIPSGRANCARLRVLDLLKCAANTPLPLLPHSRRSLGHRGMRALIHICDHASARPCFGILDSIQCQFV
ncbi:MAG: hypothetical protein IT521_10100 [Burkholderiales bacterium]|nr:hypothetical protein [Burkholderiales bacterium]